MKENETFYLDDEECTVITTMYSEERKKYYVIYFIKGDDANVYVSSYDPTVEEGELFDITDETELDEIKAFLEEYED